MTVDRFFPLLILLFSTLAVADQPGLDQTTRDWSRVATDARETGLPVLVLVSSEDCAYCELLKQEVLRPLLREGRLGRQALVHELSMHTTGKLVDFNGEKVRSGVFVRRYAVHVTPTLLLLDAAGRALHEPLVGYKDPDAYYTRLQEALIRSTDTRISHVAEEVKPRL